MYAREPGGYWRYENYQYFLFTVTWVNEIPIYEPKWINDCETLEAMLDQGRCGYKSKVCVEGAGIRTVNGTSVYADCWAEEAVYQCQGQEFDNCKQYLEKGCVQTNSECKSHQVNTCTLWEKTFECKGTFGQSTRYSLNGADKSFCIDGDCVDSSYVANKEMLQALSQMAILRQAASDLKSSLSLFKGQSRGCNRACTSFKDCCGSGNGWGVSLGIGNCSEDEKELARQRQASKCVIIGTYCAEKVLGVCIRKKTNFCCFGSKLSRLLQEQGKRQLGIGFGSAEHPNCRGFTSEELSRLDFTRMNLSELFAEVQTNFKPQAKNNITQSISIEKLKQNMQNLTTGIK